MYFPTEAIPQSVRRTCAMGMQISILNNACITRLDLLCLYYPQAQHMHRAICHDALAKPGHPAINAAMCQTELEAQAHDASLIANGTTHHRPICPSVPIYFEIEPATSPLTFSTALLAFSATSSTFAFTSDIPLAACALSASSLPPQLCHLR